MKRIVLCASILALGSLATADSVTYDFDTDQSASFTVVEFNGPDSTTDFNYDYSTHVQDTPAIDVPIPAAPDSAATTLGVQIKVNESLGAVNSVTLYPDVTGLDLAAGNWTMTFDVWGNHNGDANGNTGSTEFLGFGAQDDAANPGLGEDGDDGFNYIISADGGSSNDYRYASGASPMVTDNTIPNWHGAAEVNNLDAGWTAFFPNDGTLGTAPTGTVNPGAPGKQWVSIRLAVSNSGSTRTVSMRRTGEANYNVLSTVTGGLGAFARPCIGLADYFTSVNSEPTDQFTVFDNLVIDDGVVAAVGEWTMYD